MQKGCYFLRMGGYLLQGFFAVQVLTAGYKPQFQFFEVNHSVVLFRKRRMPPC
jgi:hypothetical protein